MTNTGTDNHTDLISRKDAVAIAAARLADVPDHVDLELDRNAFMAGYIAAAGSIKAALQRIVPCEAKVDSSRKVQCADCLTWFNSDLNHTCRQQVRRNQRSAK